MKTKIKEICLYGMLGALLFVLKFVMSSLPNIEPVTLLLIAYTIAFGVKTIYPLMIYLLLDFSICGFGFWSIAHIYIWLFLLIVVFVIFKTSNNNMNSLFWAIISGAFGLAFGALYIPLYLASGGFTFAIEWWISGLPFDVMHCVGNFVLCVFLFKPIINTLLKLKNRL